MDSASSSSGENSPREDHEYGKEKFVNKSEKTDKLESHRHRTLEEIMGPGEPMNEEVAVLNLFEKKFDKEHNAGSNFYPNSETDESVNSADSDEGSILFDVPWYKPLKAVHFVSQTTGRNTPVRPPFVNIENLDLENIEEHVLEKSPDLSDLVRGGKSHAHEFEVNRVIPVRGERLITAMQAALNKMEILSVFPLIMSGVLNRDLEIEEVLGEECSNTVIELLITERSAMNFSDRYKSSSRKLFPVKSDTNLSARATSTSTMVDPALQFNLEQWKNSYRNLIVEVMRLLVANEDIMKWVNDKVNMEVPKASNHIYDQLHVLVRLMHSRLLITPEEQIRRVRILRHTWIREQRYRKKVLEMEEYMKLLTNRRNVTMKKLNFSINDHIAQVDTAYADAHRIIVRLMNEATKEDMISNKGMDQRVEQIDALYNSLKRTAVRWRSKIFKFETRMRKKRNKQESELEAIIERYDSEMTNRQEVLDQLEVDIAANAAELTRLEKRSKIVEILWEEYVEETHMPDIDEMVALKLKKKSKDKKGSKRKGSKSKKGKSGKKASKSKKGSKKSAGGKKKSSKGSKKGKKGKGKKAKKSATDDGTDEETEDAEENESEGLENEEETEKMEVKEAAPKSSKKAKKSEKKAKGGKGKKGKKGKIEVAVPAEVQVGESTDDDRPRSPPTPPIQEVGDIQEKEIDINQMLDNEEEEDSQGVAPIQTGETKGKMKKAAPKKAAGNKRKAGKKN